MYVWMYVCMLYVCVYKQIYVHTGVTNQQHSARCESDGTNVIDTYFIQRARLPEESMVDHVVNIQLI
jgi:hypothetical protein